MTLLPSATRGLPDATPLGVADLDQLVVGRAGQALPVNGGDIVPALLELLRHDPLRIAPPKRP